MNKKLNRFCHRKSIQTKLSSKMQSTIIRVKKLHKCTSCSKIFKSKKCLDNHTCNCIDQPLFTCSHCHKTFKQNGNLHTHLMRHHNLGKPSTRIDRNNIRKSFIGENTWFVFDEDTSIKKPKRFSIYQTESRVIPSTFDSMFSSRNAKMIVDNLNIIYGLYSNQEHKDFQYHWKNINDAIISLVNDRPNQRDIILKAVQYISSL